MPKKFPHPYFFSRRKRIFDLLFSSLALLLFAPMFVLLSLLVKVRSDGPVFFRQKRVGRNGKTFVILKFRTMYDGAQLDQRKYLKLNESPPPTFKIRDDPRYVGVGKFLARFGFDELPQLFNVLKGEMSLVGPRPLPLDEERKMSKEWKFRSMVKPGILSSWAISDRRNMTIKKWLKLDQSDLSRAGIYQDFYLVAKAVIYLL